MASPQTAKQSRSNGFWWNRQQLPWSNSTFFVHGIAALVIFVDQLTKAYASGSVGFVVNRGVSFGLFSSWISWIGMWVAVIFPLMMLIIVWSMLKKYPIVLGLLQGGAVSNLLDRFLNGGVRDWLTVPVFFLQFGLRNNLADWAIVIALVWYGIMELHYGIHHKTYIAKHPHSF